MNLNLTGHQLPITPAIRQNGARVYALLPIVPTMLSTIICYHLVWRRMETLQTRARELCNCADFVMSAASRAASPSTFGRCSYESSSAWTT